MSDPLAPSPAPTGLRVGYQGEPGAFGEEAALARGVPVPLATFASLLEALHGGEVDAVVLPVDNAVVGPVPEALVPLAEALAKGLAAEGDGIVDLDLKMALAAAPGTKVEDLRRARSHPLALRMCTRRLRALGLFVSEELDTAAAARQLARELAEGGPQARTDAVVCSAGAARSAGLEILDADFSDVVPNRTRFVHLRRALPVPASPAEATLPALRTRIDALDVALAGLLVQRLETARRVGGVKKLTGKATVDPARELEVRANLRAALPGRERLAEELADLLVRAGRAEQGA